MLSYETTRTSQKHCSLESISSEASLQYSVPDKNLSTKVYNHFYFPFKFNLNRYFLRATAMLNQI